MKIYFIYNKKRDIILDRGVGKLYSGYMTRNTAERQFKKRFEELKNRKYKCQRKGRVAIPLFEEEFEVIEVEL